MKYYQDNHSRLHYRIKRHLSIFKKLNFKRAINVIKLVYEIKSRKTDLKSFPIFMRINPYIGCNLKCPGCQIGANKSGKLEIVSNAQKALSLDTFKTCIDKLSDYLLKIILYDEGEPLFNKSIIPMIKYAKNKNISTVISTNLSIYLSDEYLTELVQSGLDHLIVAVDGMTQDIYEKYRKGGNLELVKNNMEKIISIKRKLSSKTPAIDFQFIKFGYNDFQVPLAIDYANSISVDAFTSFKSSPVYSDPDELPNPSLEEIEIRVRDGCLDLWATADIDYMGNLYTCDPSEDYGESDIGSLTNSDFKSLWNDLKMKELRNCFRSESKKLAYKICAHCSSGEAIPFILK